jgi:hypothetical protein
MIWRINNAIIGVSLLGTCSDFGPPSLRLDLRNGTAQQIFTNQNSDWRCALQCHACTLLIIWVQTSNAILNGTNCAERIILTCLPPDSPSLWRHDKWREQYTKRQNNKWSSRIELRAYFPHPMLQNVNFKFQPHTMFVFFVFSKSILINSCPSS